MPNATTRLVHRADVALSCYDEGAGPPVVFLASWSLPGASWRRQVKAFRAAGLRCITYDRRGHGHTPDPGHGYDFDTLADDLAAVLDAFDLHDVTLVTFSAGSGEAVRYLTRHGDARIARLAMIAPTTPLLVRRGDHPDGVVLARVGSDPQQARAGELPRNQAQGLDQAGPGRDVPLDRERTLQSQGHVIRRRP